MTHPLQTVILFLGSGPGGLAAPYHAWRAPGPVVSLRWEPVPAPLDLDATPDGTAVAVVSRVRRGAKVAVVRPTAAGLQSETAFTCEDGALYFPRLSPSGNRLAIVETPGQGYPPQEPASSALVILERQASAWVRLERWIDVARSPAAWVGDTQIAALNAVGQLHTFDLALRNRVAVADDARLPVSDGRGGLAFVQGPNLVWRSDAGRVSRPLPAPVGLLRWDAWSNALVLVSPAGVLGHVVSRFDLGTGAHTELFHAGQVSALAPTTQLPGWLLPAPERASTRK